MRIAFSIVLVMSFGHTNGVFAQGQTALIDEIIVTAQRREQPLQDVPTSIEVFSGAEILQQGYRDLDTLANFSTSVLIEPRVQTQSISIRGFGTTGNALTLDAATPFFVDGIHYGRQSQIKLAFLDVESVEVLKGPQPIYFGQNATAGAFNIRSRQPTDTWLGYVNAELGNNETGKLTFGAGGPISDKWGIRVAAIHETSDGYLNYVVTGQPYGAFENTGGRTIMRFEPTDRLRITGKVEASRMRKDSETISLCRTAGPLIFARGGPLDDPGVPPGDERSIWDQEDGTPWSQPFIPLDTNCFSSDKSVSWGGPYFEPTQLIREENSNAGSVDIRTVGNSFVQTAGNNGVAGYEDLDSVNTYVDLVYEFTNQMSVEWLSGTSSLERDYALDNSSSPFLMNYQGRGEDFDQFSSELRLRSAAGGTFEWEVGAFYEETNLSAFSSSLRANVRQSQRYNFITEDVEYAAIFGNLTVNFMDDKLSLDIGGRYQDVSKFATVEGYAASWVFAECPETPCDPALTPVSVVFDPVIDGYDGCEGEVDGDRYCRVDPSTARIFLPVPDGAPLYAMPYRETRDIPQAWWSGNAIPVGLTAPDFAIRADRGEGPYAETFGEEGFSPQATLRYRPTDTMSFYVRYAEATKIGGFDTGQTSIPSDVDELTFDTENAEQLEIGVKGTAFDSRVSYSVDLFELEMPNLQTTVLSPDPEQDTASSNAAQRVRGLEFDLRWAASENLLLGLGGTFMDGEMTSFVGAGCTDSEIQMALTDPGAPCRLFDEDGNRVLPPPSIDPVEASDDLTAIIDRTGDQAPRTPDWKFVFSADYSIQLAARYEFSLNAKAYVSDGYILDVNGFGDIVDYDRHEDLSVLAGVRNIDKGWSISLYARNILEARPTYHAENDVFPNGLQSVHLSPTSFTSYGARFEYSFGE